MIIVPLPVKYRVTRCSGCTETCWLVMRGERVVAPFSTWSSAIWFAFDGPRS